MISDFRISIEDKSLLPEGQGLNDRPANKGIET